MKISFFIVIFYCLAQIIFWRAGEHSYCCAIDQQTSTEEIRSRLVKIEGPHTTKVIIGYKPCNGTTSSNWLKVNIRI